MKNSEKKDLRLDVKWYSKKGYSKKEGVKILVDDGYCKSTASRYWDVFALHEVSEVEDGK